MRATATALQAAMRRLTQDEDGQALLYGAGVVVLIMACFITAVDLGQAVTGKIQAQNAADAAALSGAALKASVHNTRELAYRAASAQLNLARMRLLEASGLAVQEIGDVKAGKNRQTQFNQAMDMAWTHRMRMERLREGLREFNKWALSNEAGSEAVRGAAEIGYLGNIGSLGSANPHNLSIFHGTDPLAEVSGSFDGGHMVGGVSYPGEALAGGNAARNLPVPGKTLVHVAPRLGTPLGNTFGSLGLNYGAAKDGFELDGWAVAGPVEAKKTLGSSRMMDAFGLNHWYTVRLMYRGKAPGEGN
jgi:hypothetical protein